MSDMNTLLAEKNTSWSEVAQRFSSPTFGAYRLVFTSHFSGIGTAEYAMNMIIRELHQRTGHWIDCEMYAATDIDNTCSQTSMREQMLRR